MTQVHDCGFLSTEIMFEIERVRENAQSQNAEAAKSYLAVVRKELQRFGVYCELGGTSGESEHVENIETALKNKDWAAARSESIEFEKKIMMKQAKNHNAGEDPLDVIPSRVWDALK